jgi:RNA polymerase sigma-70 factor (ECF subfamily)
MDPLNPNPVAVPAAKADDEHILVKAAKAGDLSAFESLVNRYERRIFRLAMNITQNREDAEDVMQEAFLKAFEHLGDFEGHSRFYTWLVRMRRPNVVSLDNEIETEDDLLPREVEDWGPTPEERFEQTELQRILSTVIAELEPGFRIVFQLRDVEEISTEETAEILGLSVPAVKSRLLRARLKLRQKLNRYFRRGDAT